MTDDTLSTYRVMELGAAVAAGMDTYSVNLTARRTAEVIEAPLYWIPAEKRPVSAIDRDDVVLARPPRPKTLTITLSEITLNNATGILRQHGYSYTADKLDAAIKAAQ